MSRKDAEDRKKAKISRLQALKANKVVFNTMIVFTLVFLLMVGYYAYFVYYKADTIINNAYNARLDSFSETVVRGNILSDSGDVLAYTGTDDQGDEVRIYPYDNLFSHVVGLSTHGKTGIELAYNFELLTSNADSIEQIENEFSGKKNQGDNVVTTLNLDIQQTAYDSLGLNDGAVVVIEPSTGKILAMVSKPDYNPNYIEEIWDDLVAEDSESSALLNRATQGLYTPGSVFKIFTALEYIEENSDYDDFSYYCYGSQSFNGFTINCYNKNIHGSENLQDAFAHSCNGAFSTIGTSLNISQFNKLLDKMLFNTELPLSLATNKSQFTLSDNDSEFDITQAVIGQGTTLVTPIHMAMVASAIANDGVLMKPYVVNNVESYTGVIQKEYEPEMYGRLMSKNEAKVMQEYMGAVVDYGTAQVLKSSSYDAYGKTGTAQLDDEDNVNSWFVGYANNGENEIAICVVIENVPEGSTTAYTTAKDVFEQYFN